MAQECISYHINDAYEIVYLDEAWDALAMENQVPHLLAKHIFKTSLFDFISDNKTAHLYELMFAKVKQHDEPLTFHFRCDTADKRRVIELKIFLVNETTIGVRNCTIDEVARPSVTHLEPLVETSEQFLTMCSWCKKVRVENDQWLEVEEAIRQLNLFHQSPVPALTHTICNTCYARQLEELSD
jgi:hypothetical protein